MRVQGLAGQDDRVLPRDLQVRTQVGHKPRPRTGPRLVAVPLQPLAHHLLGPVFLEAQLRVGVKIVADLPVEFEDDPDQVPGMFRFTKGDRDGKPNRIGWQGGLFELRFANEYKPGAFDSETYMANGWKQAITVRDLTINYQGETRILEERVTDR